MTKRERCINANTIAYFGGYGNIVIKDMDYGINDYVYCVYVNGSQSTYHKCKVYYNNKGCYFKLNNHRLYLDNFI